MHYKSSEYFKKIGGFGALVDLGEMGFVQPELVIGMDGVGTKLEVIEFKLDKIEIYRLQIKPKDSLV